MPVVIVEMWEGRTPEQKKQLVADITAAFTRIGTPADVVHVILKDVSKQNWGHGGKLASES